MLICFATTVVGCNYYARFPLTMKRESYSGNELNINGMYLQKDTTGTEKLFLYRNGVILISFLDLRGKNNQQIVEYLESIKGKENPCNEIAYAWGIYKIEESKITIEKWMSGDMFNKYRTMKFYGEIVNDSTIYIDNLYGKGRYDFKLVPLPIKPDSTNRFID